MDIFLRETAEKSDTTILRIKRFLREKARLLAVVGLHPNTFKPHTGTKTSVLFVQKYTQAQLDEIAERHCGSVLRPDDLDALGYRGDYSFEVFNDDYVQMPLPMVAQRARRSAQWLADDVLRLSVPLPNQMRLRS